MLPEVTRIDSIAGIEPCLVRKKPMSKLSSNVRLIAGCVLISCTVSLADEGDTGKWSSFQNGGQMSVDAGSLPTEWTADSVAWTAKIDGYGQSTPIVDAKQIVVTSTSGDNKDNYHIIAFDTDSGRRLWRKDFTNPSPYKNSPMVSRAAPTPVADGDGYIVFFEGGLLVAIGRSGELRWKKDLVAEHGAISARHGLAASLEQNKDHVFVWVERMENPYLLALSKSDGKPVWKVPGVGATSWGSPRIVPTNHGDHLVCSASGMIAGFDPANGNRLWDFDGISGNSSCSPILVGPGRFLIGASAGRGGSEEAAAGSNGVIGITKKDDGTFVADFVWKAKKASSSFGSPIVANGRACFVNRSGILFQLDAETGKQLSMARLGCGGIWATPLATAEHLYLFGSKGTTSVVSWADNKEIAKNRLWKAAPAAQGGQRSFGSSKVLYAAAAVNGRLILRRGDALYAMKRGQ